MFKTIWSEPGSCCSRNFFKIWKSFIKIVAGPGKNHSGFTTLQLVVDPDQANLFGSLRSLIIDWLHSYGTWQTEQRRKLFISSKAARVWVKLKPAMDDILHPTYEKKYARRVINRSRTCRFSHLAKEVPGGVNL